jgi:hypothetical protein
MRFRCLLAVLVLAASSLSACRKYIEKPTDGSTGATGGSGGAAGTGGRGGTGGTGGAAGTGGTGGSIDVAMPDLPPPADMADVMIADKQPDTVLCGVTGQSCCAINTCLAGGCCVDGKCVPLGTSCFVGAACFNSSCGGCGGMNERCCPNSLCVAPNNVCVGGDGGATCRKCGGPNEVCCAGNTCSEGRMCANGICTPRQNM